MAACYVPLLKTIQAAWPDYYAKLLLYLRRAYWDNNLFSIPALVDRLMSPGQIDIDPVRGYKVLAANQLLAAEMVNSVDAADLLQKVADQLPEEATALARLPPERIDQLIALVDLLCTLATESTVGGFVTSLAAEQWSSRSEWLLRHCGSCFAKQLLKESNSILSAALSADDWSRFLRLLSILVRYLSTANNNSCISSNTSSKSTGAVGPLLDCIAQHWARIAGSLDSRSDVLRTIFVVQTLGRVVVDPEAVTQAVIAAWFCRLLRHPTADFKVKVKAFRLLSLVMAANSKKKEEEEELRSSLQAFGSLHLPVHSRELPEDSLEQNLYKNLFRQILAVLEQSVAGSASAGSLLYFLISVAAREPEHVLETEIQEVLARAMTTAADRQVALLSVPWTIYADPTGLFTCSVRLACLGRFLLPMATAAAPTVITRFFTQHMAALLAGLTIDVRGSEATRSTTLTLKIGAIQLFGLLYARLDQAALHAPGAPLVGLAANILREKNLFKGKGDGKVSK